MIVRFLKLWLASLSGHEDRAPMAPGLRNSMIHGRIARCYPRFGRDLGLPIRDRNERYLQLTKSAETPSKTAPHSDDILNLILPDGPHLRRFYARKWRLVPRPPRPSNNRSHMPPKRRASGSSPLR